MKSQASAYEEPPDDNLYLGIVLSAVVTVTAVETGGVVERFA